MSVWLGQFAKISDNMERGGEAQSLGKRLESSSDGNGERLESDRDGTDGLENDFGGASDTVQNSGDSSLPEKELGQVGSKYVDTRPGDINEGQIAYTEKQVQDIKALLDALASISRSVSLSAPLFERVQSIAHDSLLSSSGPVGQNGDPVDQKAQVDRNDALHMQGPGNEARNFSSCGASSDMEGEAPNGGFVCNNATLGKAYNEAILLDTLHVARGLSTSAPGGLLREFDEVVTNQRSKFRSAAGLKGELERRVQSRLVYRSHELRDFPAKEDLRQKNLIELYALKLRNVQQKVRNDVVAELRLQEKCVGPNTQLFDWGLMRIRRSVGSQPGAPHADTPSMPATEADERLRRKREAERQRRLEEEERVRETTRKRKFFNELLNLVREYQLQAQAATKRRKQRNDGMQAWHAKQRQRATRAERLRFQALKADDQEAYMRMVEESKNERLTTLLSKTDDLLQRLGAMVQRQKDAEPIDTFTKKDKIREKGHPKDVAKDTLDPIVSCPRSKEGGKEAASDLGSPKIRGKRGKERQGDEEFTGDAEVEGGFKKRDLLEGQRQYNSAVHAIEEIVTVQPAMLEGGQLRPYQLEGLQWMLSLYNNNLNGILADEMGLGKTIQTIALLAYLMENKGMAGPHIIIAPKAVLPNWAHELTTWAPTIIAVVYDGRVEDRKAMREEYGMEGKFNVLVTHYDLIMRDKAFLKKIRWNYMIVDEGHRLKNHDCMLSRTLVTGYHIRRRLLLTGTPIQNSLQELWSLLNFLLPAIFNSSQNFEEWFNAPFADRSDVSLTEEEQLLVIRRLHQVIRPFLLRRKKAEVEKFLPGKTQVILKCDLSAWQRLYYRQIVDSGRVGLDSGTGKSRGLLNTAMQLRKCCNHPYLFLEGRDYDPRQSDEIIRSSGKFELLDRLLPKLQKTGHRVLLFSQMTRLMDILEDYLEWSGFKYLRLDGTTKTEERGMLLQQFNAPDSPYFMFLLSTRAGGLGLNLQTADTVILFDSDWNPQMDQQAEDRAHRIGQKKEVRVFVLVSVGSIEEEILDRAKSKMGIDAKVIQAGLFNTTSTAQERREMLEEIMKRGTDALGTDVPSEREINRLSARGDHEFGIFEEMDEHRRKEEGYRSRLLEEHEVPDWVFLNDTSKGRGTEGDGSESNPDGSQVTGKRSRKEVLYTDVLSDSQWMKAVEDGEDVLEAVKVKLFKRSKRKEQQQSVIIDTNGEEGFQSNSNGELNLKSSVADEEAQLISDTDMDGKDTPSGGKKRPVAAEIKCPDPHDECSEGGAEPESKKEQCIPTKKGKSTKQTPLGDTSVDSGHAAVVSKEGASRLRVVLRPENTGANWKGLRRKRSRHGRANGEEESQGIGSKEGAGPEHEDGTDDDTPN